MASRPNPVDLERTEALAGMDFALEQINECLDRRTHGIWHTISFVALSAATVILLLEALQLT